MHTENPSEKYRQSISNTKETLSSLKRKLRGVAILRLLSFLGAAVFVYLYLKTDTDLYLPFSIGLLLVFLWLLRLQGLLRDKVEWEENVLAHIEDESNLYEGVRDGRDGGERFSLPGHTFSRDLDVFGPMSLFVQLNRSSSEGGKRTLANGLLNPLQDKEKIEKLQEAHREGKNDQDWIWRFMALTRISAMNEKEEKELKTWMGEKKQEIPVDRLKILLIIGPITVIAFVVLWLLDLLPYQFPVLGGLAQVFLVGHYIKRIGFLHEELGKKYRKISPVARQLSLLEKKEFNSGWLKEKTAQINGKNEKASQVLADLSRIMARFDSRLNPIGAFLFNFLFLYDLQTVRKLYLWREKYGSLFSGWLDLLFEMEAWAGRSSFVFRRQTYGWPQIHDGDFVLKATQLAHPLMKAGKVIGNDFSMDRQGCIHLVTGSNMSGKSTFLRALGTSVVLAQNGLPVSAMDMDLSPVFLVSSMRINDSLEDDESYFYAEIKRLEQVTRWIKSKNRPFFLLDEILRGTNSRDKHAGSEALLEKMLEYGANGMMATHDLALAVLEEKHPGRLLNFCFESQVVNDDLFFDYTLRKGVCQNLNAIFLMKKMGIIG